MGLKGNLRTMDLPEILQWISIGRKTGTLHLERASIEKRIMFRSGDIYTSWSNDPRESLGQYLIRDQRLSEEELFETMLMGERLGVPLGAVLIDRSLLSEGELRDLLERKVQDTIYDVFLWPEGRFEFVDGELQEDVQVFLNLEVTSVVLEGARRLDEWRRIRKEIPSAQATFRRLDDAGRAAAQGLEAHTLRLATAGKSVAEISLELRMSEFEASTILFELIRGGTLAAEPVEEPDRASDPVGAIKELLGLAYTRMGEKRFDQAMEAYDAVLSLDSLNQNAKKGRRAAEDAHAKQRATRTVPLDKVPVLTIPLSELTTMNIDPQEGFVLSRVNGQWDVRSILKLCPIPEEEALLIFARLLERSVIELR